ncbi:hypothetical protein [Roseibium sp. M-1]
MRQKISNKIAEKQMLSLKKMPDEIYGMACGSAVPGHGKPLQAYQSSKPFRLAAYRASNSWEGFFAGQTSPTPSFARRGKT